MYIILHHLQGISDSAYILTGREEPQGRPYVHNNKIYPGNPGAEQVTQAS